MVRRAYGREDKQERRITILASALELFRKGDGDLPSVAEIAAGAGLAKGTVYLYFRTKETIFSALLLEGWGKVVNLLEEVFSAPSARHRNTVDVFLSRYVSYLDGHRELLRLDALKGVMERNLERETLIDFKQTFLERLTAGGALIDRALALEDGRGIKLLMRTHSLTCGLWQSLGPDDGADPEPDMAIFHPIFVDELAQALAEYWRGALSFGSMGAPS